MSRKIIHDAAMAGFRPLVWKGIPVYKRIEGIKGILKEHGKGVETLFADPLITDEAYQNKESAYWLTNTSEQDIVKNYALLTNAEKEKALANLKQLVAEIKEIVANLENSGNAEQAELGKVLTLALQVPSTDCIYVVNDRILLVLWGFVNKDAEKWNFNILKLLEQVPEEVKIQNQVTSAQSTAPAIPVQQNLPVEASPAATAEQQPGKKKNRKWLYLGLLFLCLLLLVTMFFLFFFKKRHADYLPPFANRFPPFDTAKIIPDPDSKLGRQIVGNRLNAQIDRNTPLEDFARKFKEIYPSDDAVKIVYYDTVQHTIQIEFYEKDIKYWYSKLQELKDCIRVYKEPVYNFNNIPSDPGFKDTRISYPYSLTKVYGAWDKTMGDRLIVIAVIDNGFDLKHTELNARTFKPFSEITNSSDVSFGIYNQNQHGTHVAALAAGNAGNGWGASGFAPGCELMPIQVSLGANTLHGIIQAIYYAVNNGSDVINISIGMAIPSNIKKPSYQEQLEIIQNDHEFKMETQVWEDVYKYANTLNCIIVEAAGNDNILSDVDPMKRSQLIINVGACDASMSKAPFSDFGKSVSVTAPGVSVFSALPGGKYAFWNGTSMASPIVAGGVALMKSIKHNLNETEAKQILIQTGVPINSPGYQMGPLVQFDKAVGRLTASKDPCQILVDSLRRIIDSLKNKIQDTTSYLIIPPNVKDCSFAMGDWYSSNDLFNTNTHANVKLQFRFGNNCQGTMFFSEGTVQCSSPISMKIENGIFKITQLKDAPCDNHTEFYERYYFECIPGNDGVAECKAFALESKRQVINFKLYKN